MRKPANNTQPTDEHREELLDEALKETFPASDPVAPLPDEEQPAPRSEKKPSRPSR